MRAIAVIMMIQGHTVDVFLADEYRNVDSFGYFMWHFLRGFTAPIFMFTSGLVFTYLLKSDHYDFFHNPRVRKGIKRGFSLIGIGYLLRYPTYKIFDFSNVTNAQWNTFYTVDALHLIGFGLLVIISLLYLSKRLLINFNILVVLGIAIILIISPFINNLAWNNIVPQYISAYFTESNGSFFPLLPWLVYVLSGAVLGNYLYKNKGIYSRKRFSIGLSFSGVCLIVLSYVLFYFEGLTKLGLSHWFHSNGLISLRIGYVILLNGIVSFIIRNIKFIPTLVKETGTKTLMLYVIHVIILFGCAWFPGLYKYYNKSFTPFETFVSVVLMFVLMLSIVHYGSKINFIRRRKILLNKV